MADNRELEKELRRILDGAGAGAPFSLSLVEFQQLRQTQSSAWPWQVPQVPSYTSDHAPGPT